MQILKLSFEVDCPHCDSKVKIFYDMNTPNIQNGCLTVCDICDEPFCLLPEWLCKGCSEWLECAKYSFVDAIAALTKSRLIEYDVENYKRIVK
jgi:hypothetical protein